MEQLKRMQAIQAKPVSGGRFEHLEAVCDGSTIRFHRFWRIELGVWKLVVCTTVRPGRMVV
jgi:hypothetical protein